MAFWQSSGPPWASLTSEMPAPTGAPSGTGMTGPGVAGTAVRGADVAKPGMAGGGVMGAAATGAGVTGPVITLLGASVAEARIAAAVLLGGSWATSRPAPPYAQTISHAKNNANLMPFAAIVLTPHSRDEIQLGRPDLTDSSDRTDFAGSAGCSICNESTDCMGDIRPERQKPPLPHLTWEN